MVHFFSTSVRVARCEEFREAKFFANLRQHLCQFSQLFHVEQFEAWNNLASPREAIAQTANSDG
jgi:hypothetical protein